MTPVVSAVWSCDPTTALAYPARYLFTFLGHHGLLGVKGSPQWRTVTGGSRSYVDKVAATLPDIRLASPVTAVHRHADGVDVTSAQGRDSGTETFDAVVIATHPAQALRMLTDASAAERDALGGMPYSVNQTLFHRDEAVLPASPNAQASWNYRLPSCDARPDKVLVSYDMTRLQRLEPVDGGRYIVSLGESELIDDAAVLDRMVYEHPQYTPDSLQAQQRILGLGDGRLAFAGAYHGWGFHEDGALSGLKAAARLGRDWDQLPVNVGATEQVPRPVAVTRPAAPSPRSGRMSSHRPPSTAPSISHVRRTPLHNAFTYRSYSWYVDVDHLPQLPRLLRPLAGFRVEDHLGDPDGTLRGNVERYLATQGIELDGGRITMLASARVFGHVFNPLSVFWCHDAAGDLRCVVAEVHNTYGERHCYLLETDAAGRASVPKAFYVSPFNDVDGQYRMKLPEPGERLAVSIVLEREGHQPFIATMDGVRHEATLRNILSAALAVPLAPLRVAAQIRWQGIKLWARRLPIIKRPHHPSQEAVQ